MKRGLSDLFLHPHYTRAWDGSRQREARIWVHIVGIIVALAFFALIVWYGIEHRPLEGFFEYSDPPESHP